MELNLTINNYRKNVPKLNTIPADWHFAQKDHDFNTDAKFTIVKQLQTQSKANKASCNHSESMTTFG